MFGRRTWIHLVGGYGFHLGLFVLQEAQEAMRAVHMLMVDIWLIYVPFSRLMHAFTFVLSRGHTGATYGRKGMNL